MISSVRVSADLCGGPEPRAVAPLNASAEPQSATLIELAAQAAVYRILVVDDSRSQRLVLKALLERRGYRVDTAASADEALAAMRRKSFRIVISDWIMPRISGTELCRTIRGNGQSCYTYFILSSSKSDTFDIAEGLDAGADDFIAKPIQEEELMARIRVGARTVRLQDEMNRRNEELVSTHRELHTAYSTIQKDLQIAARMQSTLIPESYSAHGSFKFATCFSPCSHLGGDLVGYIAPQENTVVAYSIDVSGHGIPAALLSTVLSQSLSGVDKAASLVYEKSHTGEIVLRAPHHVAYALNDRFQDWGQSNQYFTMAYAKIDSTTGEALICQAGHPAPAIIRADGRIEFVGDGGMPVGLLPEPTFECMSVSLNEGDVLVLYSDGITEATLPNGEMLGTEGLEEVLRGLKNCPLETFGADFFAALQKKCGPHGFNDDVSALAIGRNVLR